MASFWAEKVFINRTPIYRALEIQQLHFKLAVLKLAQEIESAVDRREIKE